LDALRGCIGSRVRLNRPFLISWPHRDHDLIGWKGRQSVANRQLNVCFARPRVDSLTRELRGHVFRDVLGVSEGLLVISQPVEEALANNRYDNLDLVGCLDV